MTELENEFKERAALYCDPEDIIWNRSYED